MRRLSLAILIVASALAAVVAPASAAGLASLVAPPSACPGQSDPGAVASAQVQTMRCMTNFARRQLGLEPLAGVAALDRAAGRKSADILRCDEFSHEACGREFSFWMERVGYLGGDGCFSAGENIAWGSGALGSVRRIFTAWIHSPGHRENILGGGFRDLGVGLRVGNLKGVAGAHVWTQEFGSRVC